jgi:hypothetical protein
MPSRGPSVLLTAVLILALAAVAVMMLGPSRAGRERKAEEFQRLVGGLGLGAALAPSRCGLRFDPRMWPSCPEDTGPIPAGACFCPQHGCSIFFYPPLVEEGTVP